MKSLRLFLVLVCALAAVAAIQPARQAALAQATSFGDGSFIVGTDVQPGTYRTMNASGDCYWERDSGFGGTLQEIIANDNPAGPALVTLASTDKGFKSEGCGSWSLNTQAITASPTAPFADGTYVVGTDIAAGTWRATVGSDCYWERLSGFGGTLGEIIANDFGSSAIVTISPADKGFKTANCGTWSRVG